MGGSVKDVKSTAEVEAVIKSGAPVILHFWWENPLMGWTSTGDPYANVGDSALTFDSEDRIIEAVHAKGTSKSFDGGTRTLDRGRKALLNGAGTNYSFNQPCEGTKEMEPTNSWKGNADEKPNEFPPADTEDSVLGVLYDMLQKEVIALRKAGHEKDQSLKDKDDAIEMLAKKVDTLTKAMEVEAKKMRREVAAMEKEVAAMRVDKEHENRAKRFSNSKGSTGSSQLLPGRNAVRGGLTGSTQ